MTAQFVLYYCDTNLKISADKMNKSYIVLLIASIMMGLESTRNFASPVQLCGKYLATALSIVCESKYNTYSPERIKRSVPTTSEEERGVLSLFRTRQDAKSFVKFRRRRKRGVNDECCKKPCSIDEMKTYCAGDD